MTSTKRNPEDWCVACGRYLAVGDDVSVITLIRPDGHIMEAWFCRACYHNGALLELTVLMNKIPTGTLDKVAEGAP